MVGERFPKQKVLPGTVQEAPEDCAERVPRSLCRSPRKFPGTLQDFETLNPQKMIGERFPKQEVRQEALTTRYQEASFAQLLTIRRPSPLCTDCETLNSETMVGERFPKQELLRRPQESPWKVTIGFACTNSLCSPGSLH